METLLPLLMIIALIAGVIWILKIVGDMAVARGHSPWAWWFVSLAWSPFGSMFVLWLFFQKLKTNDKE